VLTWPIPRRTTTTAAPTRSQNFTVRGRCSQRHTFRSIPNFRLLTYALAAQAFSASTT
jgi:hypothetical protein